MVKASWFDNNGNFVTFEDGRRKGLIPRAHCIRISENARKGKRWFECSPAYAITREQFAAIVRKYLTSRAE